MFLLLEKFASLDGQPAILILLPSQSQDMENWLDITFSLTSRESRKYVQEGLGASYSSKQGPSLENIHTSLLEKSQVNPSTHLSTHNYSSGGPLSLHNLSKEQ